MASIDVMTPVFNGDATIVDAIESVRGGAHPDVTIVVVDDGSTDRTGDIVRAMAAADPLTRNTPHQTPGSAAARQRAFEATTSEYVSQLDADDISDPDRLPRLLAYLQERPDCVAVCGAARHIDAQGRPTGRVARLRPPGEADPYWLPAREPSQLPFALWRRSALAAVGGYRSFVYGEDVDLSWRLLEIGTMQNLDEVVGSYRFHASSTGSSLLNSRILAVYTQLAAFSARRRGSGQPDIVLDGDRRAAYPAAGSFAGICDVAASCLPDTESRELRIAAAFKMPASLEDRRQLPDDDDCAPLVRKLRKVPISVCGPPLATAIRRCIAGAVGRRLSSVLGRASQNAG